MATDSRVYLQGHPAYIGTITDRTWEQDGLVLVRWDTEDKAIAWNGWVQTTLLRPLG
jgi:hypothetical protein